MIKAAIAALSRLFVAILPQLDNIAGIIEKIFPSMVRVASSCIQLVEMKIDGGYSSRVYSFGPRMIV